MASEFDLMIMIRRGYRAMLFFNIAAHEIVVVVTPEPTSITDAYADEGALRKHGERSFGSDKQASRKKWGLQEDSLAAKGS
jgi:hypothetical protein